MRLFRTIQREKQSFRYILHPKSKPNLHMSMRERGEERNREEERKRETYSAV